MKLIVQLNAQVNRLINPTAWSLTRVGNVSLTMIQNSVPGAISNPRWKMQIAIKSIHPIYAKSDELKYLTGSCNYVLSN